MKFAVVDVETSVDGKDLNPEKDECCEFAIIVADYDTQAVICQFSQIYKVEKWNKESAEIHKIPENLAQAHNTAYEDMPKLSSVINLEEIDYIIAHNASYDKGVIKRYWPDLADKNWICSHLDFTHPKLRKITSRRLSHLAADYEVTIPGWHRAHNDCYALLQICFQNDLNQAWVDKSTRKFNVKSNGEYRSGAPEAFKKDGWRWDNNKKSWVKYRVPSDKLKETVEFGKNLGYAMSAEEVFKDY